MFTRNTHNEKQDKRVRKVMLYTIRNAGTADCAMTALQRRRRPVNTPIKETQQPRVSQGMEGGCPGQADRRTASTQNTGPQIFCKVGRQGNLNKIVRIFSFVGKTILTPTQLCCLSTKKPQKMLEDWGGCSLKWLFTKAEDGPGLPTGC